LKFIKLGFKIIVTTAALLMIAYFGWKYAIPRLDQKEKDKTENTGSIRETAHVKKVIDGDTFEAVIDGKTEKIRMLGIDAPEKSNSEKFNRDTERTNKDKKTIQRLGELAYEYALKLIGGRKLTLVSEPKGDNRDRYNRLLRYVYLDDGTFVNLKIVQEGYANAYRKYDLSKQIEFIKAEENARENKKGLWENIDGIEYFERRDK
jgi:micrococcal nuclease